MDEKEASPPQGDGTPNHKGAAIHDSEREQAVLEACKWRDLGKLRALAESPGGFLTDSIRQQAWPILLGLSNDHDAKPDEDTPEDDLGGDSSWKELPRHRDEDQVRLDVDRSFVYYPDDQDESELARQRQELSALIVEVLRRYPYLCYFQGYHDICQVVLLVLPPPLRSQAVARLSVLRIRDFMLPTLAAAIAQLRLLPDILRAADPALWRHLAGTEPFFALSGTLTMYAHDITTLGEITRLFDVLLAREPAFSVYMFAAIVRSRRAELFATPADEPDMLHCILSKLPRPLDLDVLIADAVALFERCPPERLPAWRRIARASVLRTARDADACAAQSVADGRAFFDRHVAELRRLERRDQARALLYKYRGPVRAVGLAILVGVVAIWFRRSPGSLAHLTGFVARRWWSSS